MIAMYLLGVGGIVTYMAVSWKREKEGNLLVFAIAAALIVFVIPVFAHAKLV